MIKFLVLLVVCLNTQADTLKVLFLGHDNMQLHKSRVNRYKLIPEFLKRGIEMDYTESVKDLNAKNLAHYDVLILYANHGSLNPQQEKDLLSFVENGKGFVGIHSASACFGHSPAFVELLGGRFDRHGYDWFKAHSCDAKHECLDQVDQFETKDETYVHTDLNPDINILQTRKEGDRDEPWTWTRTQGKGRIFYTAYGHDGFTWEKSGFHKLIANAVIWASNKSDIESLNDFPEFKYVEDKEGYLTNYEMRRERHKRQLPFSPEDSARLNLLPKGFEASVFVAEPNIINPIDMTWDDRGRLYVAETIDYPHDLQEYGKGKDRIKICEDTNGDGKADKFTIFAEGLSIPTSILYTNGGIIVAHAPQILFLKDNDGDDKADEIRVLSENWGIHDTHAGPSNLHYGLDNKVYGAVGYAGVKIDEKTRFGNGLFRFNMDGAKLQALTNFTNNTWGLGMSEDFEVFGSTANNDPAFHMAISYPDYTKGQVKKRGAESIADYREFFPLVPTRQVDAFGNYTAGAGFHLYTARNFPKKYWNASAFIGGPSGRLLGQFFLKPKGATYHAKNGENILASFDQYTSPVQAKTGPDGNLWMLDWSNLVIQHNPIPSTERGGFASRHAGRGAHWNPLRDKQHGRVYKIRYVGSEDDKILDLSKASTAELVETLKNDNMFWRNMAQSKIVQENRQDAVLDLIQLAQDSSVDEIGLNTAVIHALWTLQGLGQLDGKNALANKVAEAALKHKSPGVRKNAVRVLPATEASAKAVVVSGILADSDLNVRRIALITSADLPSSSIIADQLIKTYKDNLGDKYLEDATLIALSQHHEGVVASIIAELPRRQEKESPTETKINYLKNSSFEEISNGFPQAWEKAIYSGEAEFVIDAKQKKSGTKSIKVVTKTKSTDVGVKYFVDLPAGSYKLSGWMKVDNYQGANGKGFGFNVEEPHGRVDSQFIKKNEDWKLYQLSFKLDHAARVGINCLAGGYGGAQGSVWYDEVKLIGLANPLEPKLLQNMDYLSRIIRVILQNNPQEITQAIELLTQVDSDKAGYAFKSLLELKDIKLSEEDIGQIQKAAKKLNVLNVQYIVSFGANNGINFDLGEGARVEPFTAEIIVGHAHLARKKFIPTCAGCHGSDLGGDDALKSPALAGQHQWYIQTQLQKYKAGLRGDDPSDANSYAMRNIVKDLTSKQIADIAYYIKYDANRLKKHKISVQGNVKRGKELYNSCIACHGSDANGNFDLKAPKLKGLQDWYIVDSLKKYQAGKRGNDPSDTHGQLMRTAANMIKSEQDMKDLATYIQSLNK